MSRYKEPYTLYKRGNYWYYRVYNINGIRSCGKTTGKKTKSDAKRFCEALHIKGVLNDSNMKFEDYAAHFFDDNASYLKDRIRPLAKNTVKLYRSYNTTYILPYFTGVNFCDVNYKLVKDFRIKLLEQRSSNTVIGVMQTLKIIISHAIKEEIISRNPFLLLSPLPKETNLLDTFKLEEISEIYKNFRHIEFGNAFLLMALTGMRFSEALGVKDEDIKQTSDGIYYIDLKRQNYKNEYMELKTKLSRQFPIIPEIRELINFPNSKYPNFYKEFEELRKPYETPDRKKLCFHSLRHFFITNTISKGIPESKVNYYTGHVQKGINQVYINYKIDDLKEFLDWQQTTLQEIKG